MWSRSFIVSCLLLFALCCCFFFNFILCISSRLWPELQQLWQLKYNLRFCVVICSCYFMNFGWCMTHLNCTTTCCYSDYGEWDVVFYTVLNDWLRAKLWLQWKAQHNTTQFILFGLFNKQILMPDFDAVNVNKPPPLLQTRTKKKQEIIAK